MANWEWLEKPSTWGFFFRVIIKAALLFVVFNILFAVIFPMNALGKLSLYNRGIAGRERLPYGESSATSYNVSLFNVPAMFASHTVSQPKAKDEFRILLIGDSATWGWFLQNDDTLAGQLNALEASTSDGRRLVVYNLGYPIMSVTKDLMLLDYALQYEPDMILWPITLESVPREKQLFPPIVQNNADRVRDLIERYDLNLDADDGRFVDVAFLDQTLVGQRRNLADLVRLQTYGFSWSATHIDQYIPDDYELRRNDFDDDRSLIYEGVSPDESLTENDIALDVLMAGVKMAGDLPLLIVNEPMFIADGQNSDVHYNSFYPRWIYDAYQELLLETAEAEGWHFIDAWDSIPPEEFTDTPVHMTPQGSRQFAEFLLPRLLEIAGE